MSAGKIIARGLGERVPKDLPAIWVADALSQQQLNRDGIPEYGGVVRDCNGLPAALGRLMDVYFQIRLLLLIVR